jgi:ZIP family zinc transporter
LGLFPLNLALLKARPRVKNYDKNKTMSVVAFPNIVIVFIAGLITAFATGLGAVPFFIINEFSDYWNVILWGIASGIMLAASLFGLIDEGLHYASERFPTLIVGGILAGVVLVESSDRLLDRIDISDNTRRESAHSRVCQTSETASEAEDIDTDRVSTIISGHDDHRLEAKAVATGDAKTLILILGILTVHSFPEGVAIGVSFAGLGFKGGLDLFGVSIPVLAVFMTAAISIHNIPEGTAIAIPMRAMGLSTWRMVGAAVFSSLPQPIGAAIAFTFVTWAESFLPFGFGFAAGAMIYLVITKFIPEALKTGADLQHSGHRALIIGILVGGGLMMPLLGI